MTGDRAWMAPEMTPLVDAPDEDEAPVEDRRGVLDRTPGQEPLEPGQVPGPGTELEGRSRLGTTSGADRTDEGEGRRRNDPAEDPAP